jgi:sugar lactone lactonase YvrE
VIAADPGVQVAVASPSIGGESPFWHPREQALYFVDIPGKRLNRFDPKTQDLSHWDFESNLACCAPRLDGGLMLAMRDGLWHFDPVTAELKEIAAPPYDPKNERFNDGKCDPQGRFWVGTIYEPRTPALAALYCFDGDELEKKVDGIVTLNGLGWSPNGRTMYWSDTRACTVWAADFDPADGSLSARRVFINFPAKPDGPLTDDYGGRPDGAAVDTEGCYWVSLFEGGRVLRLSPEGEVLREVRLPVRCPTMPCFGGDDLRTLYITTSRENRPAAELAEQPFAGCVLSLRVDVPGLPVNLFG